MDSMQCQQKSQHFCAYNLISYPLPLIWKCKEAQIAMILMKNKMEKLALPDKTVIFWCSIRAAAAATKSLQSCPTLCDPIDGSPTGSPSLGFSRQEHWSGLPFPSPMHESEK